MDGMGLVDRERVELDRQEIAALSEHHRLQMEFEGVAVPEDNRARIEIGEMVGVRLE